MADSDPLIVPVKVQALAVIEDNMLFYRKGMDYAALRNFGDPSPEPFAMDDPDYAKHKHGVLVMWTLPMSLRHSYQGADGSSNFPLVPNRWLVVRLLRQDPAAAGTPAVTAWMVQGDAIDSSGSAYIDPASPGKMNPTNIGRKVSITPASPWQEPAAASQPFLRAVSEGNVAFAAYQPFNENVFSIFDELPTTGSGTLSYFVLGWYAQPGADILVQPLWPADPPATLGDRLARLNWTASRLDSRSAAASLYQGGVYGLTWEPGKPLPSPRDGTEPHVAIGHTGTAALVAFIQEAFADQPPLPGGHSPADVTEAFLYNLLSMLDQPGAEQMLQQKMRSEWFGSTHGGTAWTIVDAQTPAGASPAPPPDAAELAREAQWLAALNTAQAQYDTLLRTLSSQQRSLFELAWKYDVARQAHNLTGHWPANSFGGLSSDQVKAAFQTAISNLGQQIAGTQGQLAALLADGAPQIPLATAGVKLDDAIRAFAAAKELPPGRVLKAVAAPRFWSAADPVVVISNTAHTMQLEATNTLACRWPDELITALTVSTSGSGSPSLDVSSGQLASSLPQVPWAGLPFAAASLFAEFFLLDPANAALLANVAGLKPSAAELAALQQSMTGPAGPRPANAGGILPALLPPYSWQQPWQPLFLDWEVFWWDIPFEQSPGKPNWSFDGTDYDLAEGWSLPANQAPRPVLGRSILTPKPAFEFRSRLEQYLRDFPGSPLAQDLQSIDQVEQESPFGGWDFLSQTLTGFTTQLAKRQPTAFMYPQEASPAVVGHPVLGPPDAGPAGPTRGDTPARTLDGVGGGQMYINRLSIVDAFGQALQLVAPPVGEPGQPPRTSSGVFYPLRADGLTPTHAISAANQDDAKRFLQLPPRVLQPSRLDFQFAPIEGDNPILGWVLPNHLDSGLSAYGPQGTAYGTLVSAGDGANRSLHWLAAPNSPHPALPASPTGQPAFMAFLIGLAAAGPAAFDDFLAAVDESLWTIDPLGNRSDTFLSVLIGRPLAVVAANLALTLQTEALQDPDWSHTFDPQDQAHAPRLLSYQFPVRLGDLDYRQDGLLGYFLNGDYGQFNAIHVPGAPESSYLKAIAPDNYIPLGFAAGGAGTPASLTIIMDPRGSIHAQCGFLPVKAIDLLPAWVDAALHALTVTFRAGPVVTPQQAVIPKGATEPVTAYLLIPPAEQKGVWSWQDPTDPAAGKWQSVPLGPVDGTARFADTPPTLREGAFQFVPDHDEDR